MEVNWRQLQSSIIDEVKKYPCLYDSNYISRWNARRRGPYWEAVAEAVDVPDLTDTDCRRIWKGLRDKYVREIRLGCARRPDGTLATARSQWPLLGRLDFLRDHIRHRRKASQARKPDVVDYNESTSMDVVVPMFACPDAATEDVGAEGRLGSPVDFEIDVSQGPSYNTDSEEEVEAVAPSPPAPDDVSGPSAGGRQRRCKSIAKPPRTSPGPRDSVRRRGLYGLRRNIRGKRGRPTGASPRGGRTAPLTAVEWSLRRRGRPRKTQRRSVERSSSTEEEDVADENERCVSGGYVKEEEERDQEDANKAEADIEAALCRFVTAIVGKMASVPGGPVGAPSTKTEMRVDASDGDTLFLLGLRSLMSKLDAESKSRVQVDMLRLLQERVADAETRRPHSGGDDGEKRRADDIAGAADVEQPS
ncbi:uncharacterized protein [Dermacentor andersoni]|uniref:uncharacterized protein n=1 Tax=Dermacentor andersoni TaxID=34620 RepID=UPI0021554D45|nr:uncharacterized protein LOC126525591 [Dermacentor andersoni]